MSASQKRRRITSAKVGILVCLGSTLVVAAMQAAHSRANATSATLQTSTYQATPHQPLEITKQHQLVAMLGEILVRYRSDSVATKAPRSQVLQTETGQQIPIQVERLWDGPEIVAGLRLARVAPADTARAIEALRARSDVLYAEPDFLRYKETVPNDPSYSLQWALKNTGQPGPGQSGGVIGADIKAEQAWDVTTGSRDIVVAVIDEGIDISHQDLQQNIWNNPSPGSIAGIAGDVHGYDFINNSGAIPAEVHATHVAGIIGAAGNDGVGTVGVNWQVSLMSLRFISQTTGSGSEADAIRAYAYVKQMRDLWASSGGAQGANIRVTNNSYGGGDYSQAEFDAIKAMGDSGVLFVAAAGNTGQDSNVVPSYPASYDLPCVISVGATDRFDNLASFSNRGSRSVHLGAPGDSILSTTPGNTHSYLSGTSMASPHAAGVAALVMAAHPNFSVDRLRAAVLFGGESIASLAQTTVTGNRLSAAGALQNATENDSTPPAAVGNLLVSSQIGRSVNLTWTAPGDDGNSGRAALYVIRFVDQASGAKFLLGTQRPNPAGAQEVIDVSIPYRHATGTISLATYDNAGNSSTTNISVSVSAEAADPYLISEGPAAPLSTGGSPANANADDSYIGYGLPFSFPMFEGYSSSILVSTNGAIYFAPNTPRTIDLDIPSAASRLSSFQMIAGLWDDLDLRKSKRADADIYYVQPDPNRVIFRWQGVPCNLNQSTGQCTGGDPVNFEIELQRDGTIITRYGAGNTHLHPVVGIGGAEPDSYAIASHTSELSPLDLTNAPAVTLTLRTPPRKADLKIVTKSYPNWVVPGSNITYTATINNAGPDPASGVKVSDTIPFVGIFVSCATSQGNCAGAANSRTVTATLGAIQSGAAATVTIVVSIPVLQSQYEDDSTVSAKTFDPDLSSNMWNTFAQPATPNPNPISGITAIAAGGGQFFALVPDGSALAWGNNYAGQLGDGTTLDRRTPTWIKGLNSVKLLAGGASHSIAIKLNGNVWTWGSNTDGQLGDGTTTGRVTPAPVPGLTGVVAAAGGGGHTIVARNDGTVWTWGFNGDGELGDNTTTRRLSPVMVQGLTGVIAVAAGTGHSVALRSDGTVWTWGDNTLGQLGNGTTTSKLVPVQVSGLSGITRIASCSRFTVALKNDGTVWAWGLNGAGQLGDGTIVTRTVPVRVTGLSGVTGIAAGAGHTIALKSDGTVWAWGSNDSNQLGVGMDLGQNNFLTTPMPVIIVSGVTAIAAAGGSNLALTGSGTIYQWGSFPFRGYPYQADAATQRATLETPSFNPDGGTFSAAQPVTVSLSSNPATISSVALGGGHTLGVMSDGKVYAWGINDGGQLGLPGPFGPANYSPLPVIVNGIDSAKAAAGGNAHSVALKTDGTVWGWGSNGSGQLGDGTGVSTILPVQFTGLTGVTAIAANSSRTVALRSDGTVWACGYNGQGALGDGTTTDRRSVVQLAGLTGVNLIAAGNEHTLAVKGDGTVWAWGFNANGQLGDGTTTTKLSPQQVGGLTNVVAVAGGYQHTVALRNDGTVWTWGMNQLGELGDGTTTAKHTPIKVTTLSGVTAVAAAGESSLALRNDGTVWAWGSNSTGQLGIGSSLPPLSTTPIQVTGLANVTAIAFGGNHVTARTANGSVWMWGDNMFGALGDGTIFSRYSPVQLTFFSSGPLIHYTTNGSDPTDDDPVINSGASVMVNTNLTLKARVFRDGFAPSTVKSAAYVFTANAIDDARNFVHQQYLDFLSREPDQGGWDYWTDQITQCGSDWLCIHHQRIAVSAAFFIELEFQQTGSVVYRLYRAAYGTQPNAPTRANITYSQFLTDRAQLVGGPALAQSTLDFANNFVQRPEFKTAYPDALTPTVFVNQLFDTANLTGAANAALRQTEIDALTNSTKTRAQVLLDVIEINEFKTREYNRAFVLMQYFGYLQRDAEQLGYDFWLDVLNNKLPNDVSGYRGMVCGFVTSAEYQLRFGTSITRSNQDCSQ